MPDQRAQPAEQPEVPEHVMSWWIGILEGAAEGNHPVFGSQLGAKLEEQTLIVSGVLPSDVGRRDLARELRLLAERRQVMVQNTTTVAPEGAEKEGLLEQTLVAIYDEELHAKLAVDQVQGNPLFHSVRLQILGPEDAMRSGENNRARRTGEESAYQRQVEQVLAAGQYAVVATVDETNAFALRELLDEDTRSRQVLVMPPTVADAAMAAPGARP